MTVVTVVVEQDAIVAIEVEAARTVAVALVRR